MKQNKLSQEINLPHPDKRQGISTRVNYHVKSCAFHICSYRVTLKSSQLLNTNYIKIFIREVIHWITENAI